ncbi:MAG: thioredoxin-dependent thiol peroxidase [Ignavibacteriaceae bacterium]
MLEAGKKAPNVKLKDQDGELVNLADFAGKKIVLYFYPKDNTSGCTKEACSFSENLPKFEGIKAIVFGVSPDTVESHKKFSDKFKLGFSILADPEKIVLEAYGVWKEKSMYGRKYMGVERTTVIIDESGKIAKIFPKVKVEGHTEEVISFLREMK